MTCQVFQLQILFLLFSGWDPDSSMERTKTTCQVFAQLYQVNANINLDSVENKKHEAWFVYLD